MTNIKQLRQAEHDLRTRGRELNSRIAAEDRDPTDEEERELDALVGKIEAAAQAVRDEEKRMDRARLFDTVTTSGDDGSTARISGGRARLEDDPRRGFKNLADFTAAVIRAADRRSVVDERLRIGAAPTSYSNESVGEEGGFLVPPEFSSAILSDAMEGAALLPRTNNIPVTSNTLVLAADEDEAWSTSGLRMFWEGEADQGTQSKALLKQKTLRLRKLMGVFPVTEELGADAAALGSIIQTKAAASIRHKVNDALVNGTGAGQPQGVVGHGGTVSVAKETSQAAASIVIENLVKMFSRAVNPMSCEWFANVDTFPKLYDMKDNAGNRIYQPSVAGLPGAMSGLLLGRPLTFVEECPTLGTVGDIIFGNWAEYISITKGGVQTDESQHLWFDYDTAAIRVKFRVDGQPWRASTVTPAKGSAARGNFVTLATRA